MGEFYIASGSLNRMFTLRYIEEGYDCPKRGQIPDKDHYIKNLSTDFDTAMEKASEHLGERTAIEGCAFKLDPIVRGGEEYIPEWDGVTLCYGQKFRGWLFEDIVKDDFGVKYLAEGYGLNNPNQAESDCFEYVKTLPEVVAYHKAIEDENARFDNECRKIEKNLLKSQFIGSEGDSVELSVTIINKFYFDGYYGSTLCVEMREKNNIFTMFSNSKFARDLEIDDDVCIKGIVKGHRTADKRVEISDFQYHTVEGVKSTTLTRVKGVA